MRKFESICEPKLLRLVFLVFFLLVWVCVWMLRPFGIFSAAIRWRTVSPPLLLFLFLLFFLCLLFLHEKGHHEHANERQMKLSVIVGKYCRIWQQGYTTACTKRVIWRNNFGVRGVCAPFYVSGAVTGCSGCWSAPPPLLALNCTAGQA